jgi:hypothetical protein
MHVLPLEAALSAFPLLFADPIFEILDRVTTDTELDEMKSHDAYLLFGERAKLQPE